MNAALLIDHGYEPISVIGKAPKGHGWHSRPNTIEAFEAERAATGGESIGLRTGRLVGVDIDICDPPLAQAVIALAFEMLGNDCLQRVGSKGAMLCYRNETPIRKITIAAPKGETPAPKVEILGAGQQFVAYGIHPDIGKPYSWPHGCLGDEPMQRPLSELPEVTPEQLRAFANAVGAMLGGTISGDTGLRPETSTGTPSEVDPETLRAALAYVSPDRGRTDWVGVIGAIRVSGGTLELADEWSSGQLGNQGQPGNYKGADDVEKVFRDDRRDGQPGSTTFGTIYHLAKLAGWIPPNPAGDDDTSACDRFAPKLGLTVARTDQGGSRARIEDEMGDILFAAANLARKLEIDAEPQRAGFFRRGRRGDMKAIDWVWNGWLARRKLHILAGDKGAGKSTLAFTMAATITAGGKWPDGTTARVGTVLIWSAEDTWDDTILPRLDLAGADLDRCCWIAGERGRDFDPATDMGTLTAAADDIPDVALVIIDPVVSAIAGDSHKNAETRRGLQPLVSFAERCGAAVIGIHHFTKGTEGQNTTQRVSGSLAFAAVPRIIMAAKEGKGGKPSVLTRSASNIGPKGDGFGYLTQRVQVEGCGFENQRIVWGDPLHGTAEELLAGDGKDAGKLDQAKALIAGLIPPGRGMIVKGVREAASANGISWRTIENAKAALLHIRAVKSSSWDGALPVWEWRNTLPVTQP